eukprot:4821192-Karenia_brevis.AAC.1
MKQEAIFVCHKCGLSRDAKQDFGSSHVQFGRMTPPQVVSPAPVPIPSAHQPMVFGSEKRSENFLFVAFGFRPRSLAPTIGPPPGLA